MEPTSGQLRGSPPADEIEEIKNEEMQKKGGDCESLSYY